MDLTLLESIFASIQPISTWVGVLAGGTVLTYYMLPSISDKIHANAITFVWVTASLSVWTFILQDLLIKPYVLVIQWWMHLYLYPLFPYFMFESISQTIWLLISLLIIKMVLFPNSHHSKI